jgi:hypothetical protein
MAGMSMLSAVLYPLLVYVVEPVSAGSVQTCTPHIPFLLFTPGELRIQPVHTVWPVPGTHLVTPHIAFTHCLLAYPNSFAVHIVPCRDCLV